MESLLTGQHSGPAVPCLAGKPGSPLSALRAFAVCTLRRLRRYQNQACSPDDRLHELSVSRPVAAEPPLARLS